MATFQEQYVAIKQDLPAYDTIKEEFGLDAISADASYPLREVVKRIFERSDAFRKILEGLLHPETMTEMHEANAFQEQSSIATIYRRLMLLDRSLLLAETENTDEAYATFIRESTKEWMQLKPELKPIMKQLHDAWQEQTHVRQTLNYLG